MEVSDYMRFGAALVFVLALMGAALMAMRMLGFGGAPASPRKGSNRRLGVVETLYLDPKRRLVLIQRDGAEHLLLLGAATDIVIEQGIEADEDAAAQPQSPLHAVLASLRAER